MPKQLVAVATEHRLDSLDVALRRRGAEKGGHESLPDAVLHVVPAAIVRPFVSGLRNDGLVSASGAYVRGQLCQPAERGACYIIYERENRPRTLSAESPRSPAG